MGMSAERFFTVGLPTMVCQGAEQFITMSGNIAFDVKGVGGWTLHLGKLDQPISLGAKRSSDLWLSFSEAAFSSFVDGTLEIRRALYKKEMSFSGDTSLLEKFGFLLSGGSSPLATRLGR